MTTMGTPSLADSEIDGHSPEVRDAYLRSYDKIEIPAQYKSDGKYRAMAGRYFIDGLLESIGDHHDPARHSEAAREEAWAGFRERDTGLPLTAVQERGIAYALCVTHALIKELAYDDFVNRVPDEALQKKKDAVARGCLEKK